MAGGMEIFVDGSGMDEQAHMNNVLFKSSDNADLVLTGPDADTDDQIQSSTSVGRLAYTLPSLTDLFGAASMDSFSTHFIANSESESIGFEVHVRNEAEK